MGKRFLTERASQAHKTTIIEHHRTVRWSETEYTLLFELVRRNASLVDAEISKFDASNPTAIYTDYVRALTGNPQFASAQTASARLFSGF